PSMQFHVQGVDLGKAMEAGLGQLSEKMTEALEGDDYELTRSGGATIPTGRPGEAIGAMTRIARPDGDPPDGTHPVDLTEAGEPVNAGAVHLELNPLSNPQTQSSTIELEEVEAGVYEATAPNISNPGRYGATVVVEDGAASFEVPLEFSTKLTEFTVRTSETEGQPTLYTVVNADGQQLQLYADPDAPGRSELHLTFYDSAGQELALDDIVAIAVYEDSGANLATRRFGPGHFVADITLKEGDYLFDAVAITEDQQRLRFAVEVNISQ
ncbi:MAG: hypothetical protein KY393_05730, partial [Actinobacteria bacterium]|nr:hypothetical protein [Actinomycetota bacterium]